VFHFSDTLTKKLDMMDVDNCHLQRRTVYSGRGGCGCGVRGACTCMCRSVDWEDEVEGVLGSEFARVLEGVHDAWLDGGGVR
jgi:hypothetical protein